MSLYLKFGDVINCSRRTFNMKLFNVFLKNLLHDGFLLGFLFIPEDGRNLFLRKVGWLSTDCAALYSR
jgi:hypothetical protein